MIESKLSCLLEKGSCLTKWEEQFILEEYKKCKESGNPFLFFDQRVKDHFALLKKETPSIKEFAFCIETKNAKYTYQEEKNVLYDIASITKLFTLSLIYQLEKKGILSYDEKIVAVIPELRNFPNVTVGDLLKMKGKIETDGKLSDCLNKEAFFSTLRTVHTVPTEEKGIYTDVGFTLLRFFVERKVEFMTHQKMTYDQIMEVYLLKPYHLSYILYRPDKKEYVLKGNGNKEGACHDQKSRIIDSINGSAGLFASISGMNHFLKKLENYEILDSSFLRKIFSYSFLDGNHRKRSYAGIYLPNDTEIDSYAARVFSRSTLAHQGFTGATVLVDFENHIHISVLVDALHDGASKKEEQFLPEFRKIYNMITLYALVLTLMMEEDTN